jgi:MoaD family protein
MAIHVHIPAPLRAITQGQATVSAAGADVRAVLNDVAGRFPEFTSRLFDGPALKRFINVFVNDEDIRYLDHLDTALKDGDEVSIIPAVAGG